MVQINPTLPVVGGSANTWGEENNAVHRAVITQLNNHDDQLTLMPETIRDTIGAAVRPGSGIAVVHDDPNDTITISLVDSVVVLRGTGIDPTGTTDSRPAIQALIDAAPAGTTFVVPSGATLRLNSGITLTKARQRLTGMGELRFRAGGTYTVDPSKQNGFIDIKADYCWVDGIYVTNPDGVLNRGVCFIANYGRATNNVLIGFGAGIHVSPAGEYHHFTITGNHIYDIIGSGGGSSDTTSIGEDYGDGIMVWGSGALIANNVVTCKDGKDARIGIHCEGLDDQRAVAWTHDHQMVVMANNMVNGKFRRGIVTEQVHNVVIANNTVADSTWWAIAIISAHHSVVSQNTIIYTRTSADTQGNYWNPSRSAIMVYSIDLAHQNIHPIVVNNTISVEANAVCYAGIQLLGNDGNSVAVGGRIAGNRIFNAGTLSHGIHIQASTDLEVDDNRVTGFSTAGYGIYAYAPVGLKARNNVVNGPGTSGSSTGIYVDGGSRLTCNDNIVSNVVTAIYAPNQSVRTTINGNSLENATTGLNAFGGAAPFLHSDNIYANVTTPRTNMPAAAILSGNSV